jgi:hypothetical protein
MRVEYYPELLNIIKSIKSNLYLAKDQSVLLFRSSEPEPLKIDLSFNPVLSKKTVEKFVRTDVCTLCSKRIGYKPGQFNKKIISQPYLILIQNSFKLSENSFYENPEEDNIFKNMIKAGLGFEVSDFLVREILRCYFGQKDEKNPDFTKNCLSHFRADIKNFNIKGILILGQAASLLFENDNEVIRKKMGKVISIEGIPALISPGPNRIHYMNTHKLDPEAIKKEKLMILNYLKTFKKEIMNL